MEQIVAEISAAASKYGANMSYASNRYTIDQTIANPNNIYGLVREMVKGATGADSAKSVSSGITSAIKNWLYKAANPASKSASSPGSKHKSGKNHQR